jgi:rubrerythrin
MAIKLKKSEFMGAGCMVQAVGLVLLFVWPIGTFIGIALLIYGGTMSGKFICSNCGNPVVKTSTLCPHCKEPIG